MHLCVKCSLSEPVFYDFPRIVKEGFTIPEIVFSIYIYIYIYIYFFFVKIRVGRVI